MNKISLSLGIAAIWLPTSNSAIATQPIVLSPADAEIVDSVHKASLARREANLRSTISQDSVWPHNLWGDNLWCLAALYLNEKVDEANTRLLHYAQAYNAQFNGGDPAPEPWISLGMFDYARTLCLFHSQSRHFPNRLAPATEAAMKDAVWNFVSRHSLMAINGLDSLFVLRGTENHDLNYRPFHYLMLAVLSTDPSYAERTLADGHSLADHLDAYTVFFRQWPRFRAMAGLWVEIGSNTYQKYSWPALFNLHELSPDPIIREQFGKLLDLAFIEEEQISVRGWRGGGRSRADHGVADFLNYKNMLLEGTGGGSSHSRVMETSTYQAPSYAILLWHRAFPTAQPFVIRNIVPGEVDSSGYPNLPGEINHLRNDPAQANYAYRTPHYLLGSTLMNPQLVYSGISWQNRVCGMLFHDPAASGVSQVHPHIEHSGGGRPQNPFFTIQHQNVLLLQRIARRTLPHGSYNTDRISMRFIGADLHKTDRNGWIFTTNGKAFLAVRFLDGGHVWNEAQTEAFPANYAGHNTDTTRILMHAGDITEGTFEAFQAAVLANPLMVTPDDVDYRFGSPQQRIQANRYVASSPQDFVQPRINGITQELRPSPANPVKTFDSPYLSMDYGSNVAVASFPGYEDIVLEFDAPYYQSAGVTIRSVAENYESSKTTNTLVNFTVDAEDSRKLILAASWESANSEVSATWKGTDAFATAVKQIGGRNTAILYLDNPSPGTGNIVVTFGAATGSRIGAVLAEGLDPGIHVTSSGEGRAATLTTSSPALVLGAYTNNGSEVIIGPFARRVYNGTSGSSMGNAGFALELEPASRNYIWNATSTGDTYALAAFASSYTSAPLVQSFSPPDNATGVAVDSNLSITFDQTVTKGTGNITIVRSIDGFPVESFDVASSPQITTSGPTLTIRPASQLAHSMSYHILMQAGSVLSPGGSAFGGISAGTVWNITTVAGMRFEDWIAEYHTAVGGLTGSGDDPDGDGIPNCIEAWFGTRPDQPSQGLVAIGMEDGTFTFSHPENPDMPNDITGYYIWSPDLVNWYRCDGTSGPPYGPRVTVTKTVNAAATVTATATSSLATNRLFLKAAASQN